MPIQSQGANKRRIDSSTPKPTNPTGKRSRVSRACDQCRTAREKCDGQSICSTCAASIRTCTYTANPKKRGIQPGYIRTLELALTWLFNNSDAESVLSKKLSQDGASSVLFERDTKESNKLHKGWRRSNFCRNVDKLLSGEATVEEGNRSPDIDDQDSEIEGPQRQGTFAPSPVDPALAAHESSQAFTVGRVDPLRQDEAVPLPPDRWRLFDVYFAYTHCWFPICEKHDILKLSYSYPERGLHLSSDMIASGDHAELWSILALASLQDVSGDHDTSITLDRNNLFTPRAIYDTARRLIPSELGAFELGHVKALLLLALFNISQSYAEAAWLLVGHASRIVIGLEQKSFSQVSRFKHVFSGCFLLDHLLSMQLGRQSYLQNSDIERIGKIYEDGLEEWQPWTGCSDSLSSVGSQSRAPALSLSTFNRLVELIGLMNPMELMGSPRNILQEASDKLEAWKLSLPLTFEHILSDRFSLPSAPPALLIQAAYQCWCTLLFPSHSGIERMLDILERSQSVLGWYALPPVVNCLLDISERHMTSSDGGIKTRLQHFHTELNQVWSQKSRNSHQDSPILGRRNHPAESAYARSRRSFGSYQQIPTPESIQMPASHLRANSTVMDDVIHPDLSPALLDHQSHSGGFNDVHDLPNFHAAPFNNSFVPLIADQWTSTGPRNVESFFDELASLDGAERVENQPQFLENLGFAPNADIADLLTSDFGQLNSMMPQYVQQGFQ